MFENLARKGPGNLLRGDRKYARIYCAQRTVAPRLATISSRELNAIIKAMMLWNSN